MDNLNSVCVLMLSLLLTASFMQSPDSLDIGQLSFGESLRIFSAFTVSDGGLRLLQVSLYWFMACQVLAWTFHLLAQRYCRFYRLLELQMRGECASSFVSTLHCCTTSSLLIYALLTDRVLWHDRVFATNPLVHLALQLMVGYCASDLLVLLRFGNPNLAALIVHHVLAGLAAFMVMSPIGTFSGWFAAMFLVSEGEQHRCGVPFSLGLMAAANPWMNLHFYLKQCKVAPRHFAMRVCMFFYTGTWLVFRLAPWLIVWYAAGAPLLCLH